MNDFSPSEEEKVLVLDPQRAITIEGVPLTCAVHPAGSYLGVIDFWAHDLIQDFLLDLFVISFHRHLFVVATGENVVVIDCRSEKNCKYSIWLELYLLRFLLACY